MTEVESQETFICSCFHNGVIAVGKKKKVEFFVSNTQSASGYKQCGKLVMGFDIMGLEASSSGDTICVRGKSECELKNISIQEGSFNIEEFSAFNIDGTIVKSVLCSDKLCLLLEKSVEIHWLFQNKHKVIQIDHSVIDLTTPDESLFFVLTSNGQLAYFNTNQESAMNEIKFEIIDNFSDSSAISIFYSKYYEIFLVGHKNKTCSTFKLLEDDQVFKFGGLDNMQVMEFIL